jgi:hypothetical protein
MAPTKKGLETLLDTLGIGTQIRLTLQRGELIYSYLALYHSHDPGERVLTVARFVHDPHQGNLTMGISYDRVVQVYVVPRTLVYPVPKQKK